MRYLPQTSSPEETWGKEASDVAGFFGSFPFHAALFPRLTIDESVEDEVGNGQDPGQVLHEGDLGRRTVRCETAGE